MPLCDEVAVLWPDQEHVDVRCARPQGHPGRHRDEDGFACWDDTGPALHDEGCSYCKEGPHA